MQVKAIRLGYYDHVRRKEGEIFSLKPYKVKKVGEDGKPEFGKDGKPVMEIVSAEDQFSENWMEVVDGDEAEEGAKKKERSAKKGHKGKSSEQHDHPEHEEGEDVL